MIRHPAVADQFYTGNPAALRAELRRFIVSGAARERAIGIIAPHAGYIYSGAVAGQVYGAVSIPENVIIMGPNHHGIGARAALFGEGEWLTPLGAVEVNSRLAGLVKKHAPLAQNDATAHHYEHSLEVQVPFLQYVRPDIKIVPICLGFSDFSSCEALGKGIAQAISEFGEEVLIVASSDMTHYESAAAARAKDEEAIGEILAMNPERLLRICRDRGITMCGVIPATVMLVAALELGAKQARVVGYATSCDVTGDNRQVVAYAAIAVS
ncbi:MAG TPA: AmmeMemoRadiSam system protein B [Geobacteraceae bacterium]